MGRGALAGIVATVIVVVAGVAFWLFQSEPGQQARPTVGPTQQTGEGGEGAGPGDLGGIGVLQIPRAAPELGLTQGPEPIDLGHRPYGRGKVRVSVRVRRVGGRADPITMSGFTVRLAEGSAAGTTVPTIVYGAGECGSGSYELDDEGTYCNLTVEWDPDDDEKLKAVVAANVAVWESERAVREAATLDDRPGGWDPYEWEWEVQGVAAPAPPDAEVSLDPGSLEWSAESGQRGESVLKIVVKHRDVVIEGIRADPPNPEIKVSAGREGSCVTKLEAGRQCPARVRWTPQGSAQRDRKVEGEIAVSWRDIDHTGKEGRLQTSAATYKATHIADERTPEARMVIEPSELHWKDATEGEETEEVEVKIEVHDEKAVVESIGRSLEGERSGVELKDEAACQRVYEPGGTSNKDWCRFRVRVKSARVMEEGAAVVVVWSHGTKKGGGDRQETRVPVKVDVQQVDEDSPARLSANPKEVDLGTVRSTEGRTVRVTFTNTGGGNSNATIERMNALDAEKRPLGRVAATMGDCQGISLGSNEFCDATVRWAPLAPGTLEGVVEIVWRKDGVRERTELALKGVYEAPEEAPQAPAADPEKHRRLLAQASFRQWRSMPGLEGGHIDMGAAHRSREQRRRQALGTQRIVDRDHAQAGGAWLVSGRPVDLNPVVLSNSPIPAVLTNRCNAVYDCVVVALVERDVWGAGAGRAVVIPRGSKILGRVKGFGSGGTDLKLGAGNARVNVSWSRIVMPDGAAFGIKGGAGTGDDVGGALLATGNVMGGMGLPAVVDPYEMELYISKVGRAGLRALSILTGPDITYKEVAVLGAQGEAGAVSQRQPTKEELAAEEIQKSLTEVAEVMAAFQDPIPSIVVPAGTRMRLYPRQSLKLMPITGGTAPDSPQEAVPEEPVRMVTLRPADVLRARTGAGTAEGGTPAGNGGMSRGDEAPIHLGIRTNPQPLPGATPDWAAGVGQEPAHAGAPEAEPAIPMPAPPGQPIEGLPATEPGMENPGLPPETVPGVPAVGSEGNGSLDWLGGMGG